VYFQEVKVVESKPDQDVVVEVEVGATNIEDGALPSTVMVGLLPVEVAPEVLAVNSDFDEGRIDPATGYAIPDCDDVPNVDRKTGAGNGELLISADRDHLDGNYSDGDRITEDLHKGWFGVNPTQLGDDFWDGATVTIRKLDKVDEDTGQKESGQVRFYAKWGDTYYGINAYDFNTLAPNNLVTSGVNARPGEGVYGSTSTIPDNAEFWMEGVRPGKITLEWRLQKGSIDVKHEQTFFVATQKSVADWKEEVRYQIRLQTKVASGGEVDIAAYNPANGFRNLSSADPPEDDNRRRVQEIYYYYRQLYLQYDEPLEEMMWAGMAKTAAAPIYGAMSDLSTYNQLQQAAALANIDIGGPGTNAVIKGLLCNGQLQIFGDKGWPHRAFVASGIWALNHVAENAEDALDIRIWRNLAQGIFDEDPFQIEFASRDLLLREQRDIIQESYTVFASNQIIYQPKTGMPWIDNATNWLFGFETVDEVVPGFANVGEWLSANSKKNPMPGGKSFRDVVPGGRIDHFQDRWAWSGDVNDGMFLIWAGSNPAIPNFDRARRQLEAGKSMYDAAFQYAFDGGGLPLE